MNGDSLAAPLPPGSTIGILGCGQLGRMLAMAAARVGLRAHVYGPDAERPAADVAAAHTAAAYDDEAALSSFAAAVDVVTYEFENVPAATARFLDARVPVRPGPSALALTQDRLLEKTFLRDSAGIATAAFRGIDDPASIGDAVVEIGLPAVLKTRRFGYDGKGQVLLAAGDDAASAWAAIGAVPAILEAFVPFTAELSVIAARGLDGAVRCYEPVRNIHENHVLVRSLVPAGLDPAICAEALAIAGRIVEALDYVGVIGVEMFLEMAGGKPRLYVNEVAPRVHNSGHWTLDACLVSQFEQHVRAICGWPLGSVDRHSDVVMENLLGNEVARWPAVVAEPNAALHVYGKRSVTAGRKMGHVTRLFPLGGGPASLSCTQVEGRSN